MVENFRKYDLSFIVVAHAEGRMLHPCLTSVDRAVAQFEQAGHSAERILVLSDASEATKRWAGEMRQPGWRLLSSDHPDPGRARNLALRESRSDYVALLDGWDLTCGHWLVAALEADRREGPAAWHPEAAIRFGEILTCSTQFHPDAAVAQELAGAVEQRRAAHLEPLHGAVRFAAAEDED